MKPVWCTIWGQRHDRIDGLKQKSSSIHTQFLKKWRACHYARLEQFNVLVKFNTIFDNTVSEMHFVLNIGPFFKYKLTLAMVRCLLRIGQSAFISLLFSRNLTLFMSMFFENGVTINPKRQIFPLDFMWFDFSVIICRDLSSNAITNKLPDRLFDKLTILTGL